MKDPEPRIASDWSGSPTVKSKNAVQRAVTALLDELAPERVLKRAEQLPLPVEQHRTPTGCVLQAPTAAISVSWFADAAKGAPLGELHVVVWRGTVARRGATRNQRGATIVEEHILLPIEPPAAECLWQATDGTKYDTAALAAWCLALLESQVRTAG